MGDKLRSSLIFPLIAIIPYWGLMMHKQEARTDQKTKNELSHSHEGEHHRFNDVSEWVKRFEDPERDEWQKPDVVIQSLDLAGGEIIADIGSATGYFPVRFARAVPEGKVYGVDIEKPMVDYLNDRAKKEGLANLLSIHCEPDDPKLPEPVDIVFICDTYHHILDRVEYFGRLKKRFKPGGRLVIVDFVKRDIPVGPPASMKLDASEVISELAKAGYHLTQRSEVLPYQYFLVFQFR